MARSYPEYDYDLAEGLLAELSPLAATRLAAELAGASQAPPDLVSFFAEYGRRVANQLIVARKKYPDRTAEVAAEVAQKTGLVFPVIPQGYVEIWLLGTRPEDKWQILEATTRRFTFAVSNCSIYRLLQEKIPSNTPLPCREGCLAVLKGIYQELKLPVQVTLERNMEQDGVCRFGSEIKVPMP